jgi:ADP-heptose:LPS heptosyltransferase
MNAILPVRPAPIPQDAKTILVIKLGALGDVVQALAAAKMIREHHFGARITLLTTEPYEEFHKACPYFDVVESDGRVREPQGMATMLTRLRAARYDAVYDLQTNDRTRGYFLALTGQRPKWSGVAPNCSHFHANPERENMHTLDRLADQLWYAGMGPAEGFRIGEAPLPDLSWVRTALRNPPRLQPQFFGIASPYILLVPGASEHRPEKRWPADRFGQLAQRAAAAGLTPVIIGAAAEREAAAVIAKMEPRAKNVVSRTTLFQVAALAETAAGAVGNDTGPMHLAAAAGAPCVVLFSEESNPDRVCPRSRGGVLAIKAESLADLPVADVGRALQNIGALARAVG